MSIDVLKGVMDAPSKEVVKISDKISYKAQISCKTLDSFFGNKEEKED